MSEEVVLAILKKYKSGRKRILKTGYISYKVYIETIIIQFVVCILPNGLRGMLFKKY